MAPPESYMDFTTSEFNLSLLNPFEEWSSTLTFNFHGRNAYSYLYKKYEQTTLNSG